MGELVNGRKNIMIACLAPRSFSEGGIARLHDCMIFRTVSK